MQDILKYFTTHVIIFITKAPSEKSMIENNKKDIISRLTGIINGLK